MPALLSASRIRAIIRVRHSRVLGKFLITILLSPLGVLTSRFTSRYERFLLEFGCRTFPYTFSIILLSVGLEALWGKLYESTWLLLMGNERSMLGFVWKLTCLNRYSGGMTLTALSTKLFMKASKPSVFHADITATWSKTV
ncbi:hypothetical protein LINPERPRIM_LOCUS21682 [Linum perenne]